MPEPPAMVFVVDDDVSVREALGSLLRSAGLRVETFATAQEFLARPRVEAPRTHPKDSLALPIPKYK